MRALTGVWRTARRLVLGGALLLSAGAALAAAIGVPYVQVGHSEVIDRAHLTPDGRFAVTTSGDRTIRVWDVASGREIRSIEAKMKGLGEEAEVALSPDGAVIATTDSDGDDNFRVRRWDIATGRELPPINAKEASRLVFTPDGRSVVTLSWKSAKFTLHDIATGKPVRTFGGTAGDDAMAISPDSKWLAAFSETDEKVHVWDIRTGQRMKSLPYGRQTRADTPNHFEFSRDGSMLLASGFHETYLWDTTTWTPRPLPAGRLRHGRFGATANVLVAEVTDSRPDAAYQGGRRNYDRHAVWDIAAGRELRALATDALAGTGASGSYVRNTFAVSADGRLALFTRGRLMAVFDLQSGAELRRFAGASAAIDSMDVSPDGRRLAIGTGHVWDLDRAVPLARFGGGGSAGVLRFSPDGKVLFTGIPGTMSHRIDPATGAEIGTLNDIGDFAGSVSADGTRLLSIDKYTGGYDAALSLIDTRTGKRLREFEAIAATQFNYTAAAISPDGRTALVGAYASGHPVWSPPLALWNLDTGKVIRYLDRAAMKSYATAPVRTVAISPDGRIGLSTKPEVGIKVWDLATGKLLRTMAGDAGVVGDYLDVETLAFSRDGARVVAGYRNGAVVLWEVATGRMLHSFTGHGDTVRAVAFSPDGRLAFSAGDDTTTRVWDTATGRERVQFVAFTDGEWIAITPEGYFNASPRGAQHVNVRTGVMSVTSVDAYFESFFRPDIVVAALHGTAVETGTSMAQAKPAPRVEIVDAPVRTTESSIGITLRITDLGGGIGDVRVYRNGTAVSLESADDERGLVRIDSGASATGARVIVRKVRVKLDAGSNVLRAIAFDAHNQARSEYADVTVEAAVRDSGRPTLHAVVVGIDAYRNPKLNLKYAVADADLFAKTLTTFGAGLFERVVVTKLTSREDTTRDAIAAAIGRMRDLAPNDMFVFFVASHGTVDDGSYYLITSNVGSLSTEKLKTDALSQADLTRLLANVPTGKKLLVLDTCNSGALGTALQTAMLTRGMSEDTAAKVLSRAVGSSILSSATSTQEALEGYEGHGLFSHVLNDGLSGKADANKDGFVTTSELIGYVDEIVPMLANRTFGREQFPTVNNNGQVFPVSRVP